MLTIVLGGLESKPPTPYLLFIIEMDTKYQFYLDKVEEAAADEWMLGQSTALAAKQAQDPEFVKHHREVAAGIPYTGAIGGMFSFTFIRTGLGNIIHVKNTINGEHIDVTNYDWW